MERKADDYVYLNPTAEHTHSLVWLHGLGDSAYGFATMFESEVVLPGCRVILPTAPERAVTCNGGMHMTSWYDIKTLDRPKNMTIEDAQDNYS